MKIHLVISFVIATLLGFFISGCATNQVRIEEVNTSPQAIRRAIVSLMGTPRVISPNQRMVSTPYFNRKEERIYDVESEKERFYANITVLGDRRPYDVSIEVIVEHKNNGIFRQAGVSRNLAERLRRRLMEKLTQSPDELNIIDDFRAF